MPLNERDRVRKHVLSLRVQVFSRHRIVYYMGDYKRSELKVGRTKNTRFVG